MNKKKLIKMLKWINYELLDNPSKRDHVLDKFIEIFTADIENKDLPEDKYFNEPEDREVSKYPDRIVSFSDLEKAIEDKIPLSEILKKLPSSWYDSSLFNEEDLKRRNDLFIKAKVPPLRWMKYTG